MALTLGNCHHSAENTRNSGVGSHSSMQGCRSQSPNSLPPWLLYQESPSVGRAPGRWSKRFVRQTPFPIDMVCEPDFYVSACR